MRNLSSQKLLAVVLSGACTLSVGSLARTVAIAMQVPRAGVQPPVPHLPVGILPGTSAYTGSTIKGHYGVLSLNNKTGSIFYSEASMFDDPTNPAVPYNPVTGKGGYNPSVPFTPAMQGLTNRQ